MNEAGVESRTYAVTSLARCKHCGQAIEFRQRLGWLHVRGFYACLVPKSQRPPYLGAEPTT